MPFVLTSVVSEKGLQNVALSPWSKDMEEMILAVPVHQKRVSPLFDVASRVRIVEFGDSGRADRGTLLVEGMTEVQRVTLLKRVGVQCLLCAGISGSCSSLLRSAGIQVVDGVVGDVEDVMDAHQGGRIREERFRMPGCGGGWRHRKGYRGGRGGRGGRRGPQ